MTTIPDVDGNSSGDLATYYHNMWVETQNAINPEDKDFLRTRSVGDLIPHYIKERLLPILEIDPDKNPIMEEVQSHGLEVAIKIGYPLKPVEGIDRVVRHRSSTYFGNERYRLENCCLVTQIVLNTDSENATQRVEKELEDLKTIIQRKNADVLSGNERLDKDTRSLLENKKSGLDKSKSFLETLAEDAQIELVEKNDAPVIDLDVKQEIKVLQPEAQEKKDPDIAEKSLKAIIKLIRNQGRSFELTPKVFFTLEEEWLRDIILAMLNAVLEGSATGETFVKLGKADIYLNIGSDQKILTGECKWWHGQSEYQKAMNQHFNYLTTDRAYAIQITFSKNKGFTDVLEESKKTSKEHNTYLDGSFREIEENYFITEHKHPEDSQRKVEFHHLLFNLFYEKQRD